MNKIIFAFICLSVFAGGCNNLSPRNDLENKINNQQGEIEELKNLQNSLNFELGKLRSENKIQAEQLKNFQQGLVNYNKDNSGVQILQGDGALMLVFGLSTILIFLVFHYWIMAKRSEKAVELLAEEIVRLDDVEIEDSVFRAAMSAGVGENILNAMVKQQKKYGIIR